LCREESHHVRDVLRARTGDDVVLFDGEGREAQGRIVGIAKNGVEIDVNEVAPCPNVASIRLTLATAMPRAQRQSFLFEKCTELGVWSIWPTIYERSVVKPGASHVDKWRRTTIEAGKQCGRARLPRIEGPYTFAETIARACEFDRRIVTDADPAFAPLMEAIRVEIGASRPPDVARVTLLVWIGPEGGLTREEIASALSTGAVGATLGSYPLRIETAAVAVCALGSLLA